MRSTRHSPAGFTLVELVVSLVIMSILLGSMASAVILASHALPDGDDPLDRTAAAVAAVERIARDLALADPITMADPGEARFYVPDRGHGTAGPEKVIYAWSGVAGDPVTFSYNSAAAVTVCEDVYDFTLEYIREARPLLHTPRVLLVVDGGGSHTAQESAKQALIESWGFSVQLIGADSPQGTFEVQYVDADVLYISETSPSAEMAGKDFNPRIGVINEEQNLYDEYGISQGTHALFANDHFWVVDDTHEITAGLGLGAVQIFDADQDHIYAQGNLAPGAQVLTQWSGFDPTTVVIDAGGELYGGGRALRRRVGLVWGSNDFDINLVNNAGRKYMRQAIVWAAAPAGIGSIRITLQIGSSPTDRVETEVQLLNKPEEP